VIELVEEVVAFARAVEEEEDCKPDNKNELDRKDNNKRAEGDREKRRKLK
jgi:hypothetical protein